MDKNKIMLIAGVVGIVGGAALLAIGGIAAGSITALVEAVVVIVGLIAAIFAGKKVFAKK